MEDVEVLAAAPPPPPPCLNNDLVSPIAKGKRTKRQRPLSPVPFTTTTPTHNNNNVDFSSATSSEESTTTEELDIARCLILLSRGYFSMHDPPNNNNNRYSGHNASSNKAVASDGSCVYTCKTCNRSFPSFQALGGHRTSHKKPRNERRVADEDDFSSPSSYRFQLSSLALQLNNAPRTTYSNNNLLKTSPSPRMHECSYCGAEFTSGQALGGHMRKHRGGPIIRSPDIVEEFGPKGSKNPGKFGLSLDLNFPAPEDEKVKSPQETNQRLRLGFSHHQHYSTID